MNSKLAKLALIASLGCFILFWNNNCIVGAYSLIQWLDSGNTSNDNEKEETHINENDEETAFQENEQNKKEDKLLDDTISIESIIKEDSLYNSFTFTQLRAIFYEFYRRAVEVEKNEMRMKVWTEEHFREIFQSIDITEEDVPMLYGYDEKIVKTMVRVWDYDKDGFVNIRDFVHTFAYAQLGSENARLSYIFDSADLAGDGVLSFEEIRRNIHLILQSDNTTDPEQIDELSILHTRDVFEKLQGDMVRGVSKSSFLSKGRFLSEEISLLRTFALASLNGDMPPIHSSVC